MPEVAGDNIQTVNMDHHGINCSTLQRSKGRRKGLIPD